MAKSTLAERFWAKTQIVADCDCRLCTATVDPTAKCIVWAGAEKGKGYGAFWDGTRTLRAHRFAYELVIGPIPDGLELDHLCRVRACVAPAHLEPVTADENRRRGLHGVLAAAEGRLLNRCQHGHELTPENTYLEPPSIRHPQGRRRCRTCRRAQDRLRPSGGFRMRRRQASAP